jgi:DNA-directed RNA polymerase subunit N (RpoN/RPB10)
MKSEDVQLDAERHIFKIGGKFYRLDADERNKPMLIEVDIKKYDEMVGNIMKNIEGVLDTEKLLRYCLNRMPLRELKKVEEMFKSNRKRKPKMRTKDGCIELSIGGVDIPIVD